MRSSKEFPEKRVPSKKYPGLSIVHEVCFDWIINHFLYHGTMPLVDDIKIGMGFVNRDQAITLLKMLFRERYLEGKQKVIRGFGARFKVPVIRTLFERVYVGPLPRKMTADEAIRVGYEIYSAGKRLKEKE